MLLLGDITVSTLNNIYLIPLNDGSPALKKANIGSGIFFYLI